MTGLTPDEVFLILMVVLIYKRFRSTEDHPIAITKSELLPKPPLFPHEEGWEVGRKRVIVSLWISWLWHRRTAAVSSSALLKAFHGFLNRKGKLEAGSS